MRLLPTLLLFACLQEPNVSQETSDANQGYVIRYNGGNMCVVKGINSVACLPTEVEAGGSEIEYDFVNQLPITTSKDKERNLLSFELSKLHFSFTDDSKEFRNCSTRGNRPWLRNMPFTIKDKSSLTGVTCHDVIDIEKVKKEKKEFISMCPLADNNLEHKYKGIHYYTYKENKCELLLNVNSSAINYLKDIAIIDPELMQCPKENDSLMKFKLSDGNLFTIACTDDGIEFRQGDTKVAAKMATGKTYAPYDNEYELLIYWDEGENNLKVTAKLPKSSGILDNEWASTAHETRLIIYNVQGEPISIERQVRLW